MTQTKFKQTEIGNIPLEWDIRTISQVADIFLGGTPKTSMDEYWGGDVKWASAKDISNCNSRYIYETERRITKEGVEDSSAKILPKDTIILTSRGTVGKVALLPESMSFNQTCYGLKAKDDADALFLYYCLKNSLSLIKSMSYGTVFSTITMRTFDELKLTFPPLKEQIAIAKILSDLDSKIELNQRMNQTLEAVGQALFKHWFVDFEFPNEEGKPYKSSGGEMMDSELGEIPKGWSVKNLCEICELTMGLSPKGDSYNEDGIGSPLLNGAADFSGESITPKNFTTQPTRICKHGDLIFCIRGTIGNLVFSDEEYCLGRGVAAITPREKRYSEIIYFSLKNSFKALTSKAAGSVIVGLSKPDIEKLKISLPDKNALEIFHKNTRDIFLKKSNLSNEIQALSSIRDVLLPKLMSGEIRIKNA